MLPALKFFIREKNRADIKPQENSAKKSFRREETGSAGDLLYFYFVLVEFHLECCAQQNGLDFDKAIIKRFIKLKLNSTCNSNQNTTRKHFGLNLCSHVTNPSTTPSRHLAKITKNILQRKCFSRETRWVTFHVAVGRSPSKRNSRQLASLKSVSPPSSRLESKSSFTFERSNQFIMLQTELPLFFS